MPEEKDKIKKLYDTFVSDGYDMESEEDFRKNLLDSTKRKAAYDALVKDGYDMEPFEEFESNIGFGKERTSSQQSGNSASGTVEEPISPANEQTWQPTEKEKVAMLTETDRIMNDVKSHTQTFNERIDNMQEYGINPGLQTKEGKMIFNPESGKLEKTFLTPAGNRYYSKSLADMESFQYRQAADMSIGGQLRKANLRLQELKAKQAERASEVHKEWAEETENNKAPLAAILGAATYTPRQQSDKENRALSVAIRETEELIKNLEEQKDRENGVDVGFWRGFGRTMGDVRTWDFGMGDMRDAFTMMNADELKKENATEGEREAHDAMMGAIHEKQQAEERYSGNADFWNRAGVMTGYMPSFMLDFVLTGGGFNGLSSFSKGSTRLATKVISKETAEKMAQQGFKSYIKENGAKGLGRYATDWTIKALGTTADDLLVRAPLMANTVQAGKTTADIIDRKLGDVVVDENGNYDFSNDKTWGDAIWQSEANAIIENYSEMFGAHLDPVFTLGNMSKLANVVGAKRIGAVLSKADASALNGIMEQTHQMFNKMGVSDYVGEVSEEYYGQLWRTMLNLDDAYQQNPDGTRTNLFASGQFHGDIWGGMALSMGLMGAGKHTLSAANYTSMKHGVNKADAKVNELLGKEVWEPLKATLDLTTNENIGEVAELIAGDKDFTINEKAAVLDYMERSLNLRGFNLASMAQSRGGNRNESVQQANDSYLDGYNIISSQEMNDAKNMYEYQRARVADLVDESMFAMIEENPIAALEFVNGNEQWNDEDKVSVIDYINAKQVYNGMIQRVHDDIDGRIEQSNSMIDARVNRNTGMIQGATMKQDERKVYVISGKLVPYDDGSGVSVTDSDNSIIIRDSETGALEQVSPDAVLSLDESQDPNEQKELAEQAIVEQFAREAADKIDGKVTFNSGDAYTITGQDGSQMQVQVIANEDGIVDNGDGTVNVSDGVNIFPLAKETIQQQADAANLARVAQFEQQRTIENAERKQEMQEAERPQYALNDIVSLTDENGVTVRGNITADADADGKYEVFTEAPINGKRVNLFTRDELDNMLLEHNGVAFERPAENESNNGAENIPENDNNAPQNIPAMQRIPKDEQGNPLYEQADSDTAWDAIVEQTEGDEDMAQTVADGMVADKEEALKKLEKAKSKGGNSIAEKIASEKERKAAIDAAKQELLVWQKIAGTAKRRKMEADDERRRIADEAAALRKAEEEKLRAEREEAERIEREALNGVPDMVDDKPQDARARGYRRMNGHKIDRQEPVQALQGKEVSVKFSDDAIVGGRVAVIDVNLLQPSHIQGVRNPLHFIDEAQPKERNDEASVLSARKIAGNIRPEEITSSVTAYTGAPTVNARGEAIQGNNRSDALRIMWENHPEQAALYKQYLKDHAEEFGLQAEDIEAMEHPVLVNMVDVDDAEAIRLGQYVAQDTESGGVERIKPKNALQRMGAEMRSFANLLLRTSDDEMSFAGLVDSNGANVLKWMNQRGFITPTQYKSAFDSKGNLTPESKNDLRGIMYQSIFKDGSTRLEEMFNVLPVKAQKAILATAFRDYDSPNSERMVDEIQNSVRAYYALSQDKMFAEAKNFKEARTAIESWKRQYQMDDVTGESYLPADNFSNFVLHLAAMYKGESQSFIQNTFGKIYDLIQGTQEETLFEQPDNTPRTLVQAIKEALNLDYNGQQRSNVLVGDTATSQRGQQGSNGTLAPRERVENRNGTTDDTGRTESIGGQSEIESSLSQEEMLFSDDTDNQLSAKIARRIEVQEDDWIESGKYGDTYKQTIIVDGTHKVIKVDAPDTKGNYIGSAYEYDGQTFGDLLDVLNYIDASLSLANAVAVAEKETDTTPTEKQKEAGNYKKGHVQVGTFNITIENPKGSVRSGIDTEGNKWETIMQNTYGYIRGTEGVDGDHIDVFLSDDIDGWNGRRVFVVDQYNEDGSFDEHKVMLGFNETDDAEAAYFANYDSDWAKKHKTVLTAVNLEDFEKWIDSSHRKTKAFAEYKSVKTKQEYKAFNDLLRDSDTAHPPYEGDVKMLLRLANKVLANGIKSIEYGLEEVTGSVSVNSSDKSKLDKYYYSNRNHTESGIDYSAYKGNISIVDEDNQTVYNFSYEPPQYKGKDAKLYVNVARIVGEEETTESIDTPYTITPAQYTTKRGKVLDMHLVKFNNELRDTVRKHTTMFAKQLKGWWDKEKQGFMMRSKEDAERLAEYATDAQSQPPVSMSDIQAVNDGNVQFAEPKLSETSKPEEKQEYTPVWQYSVSVDKETGLTTLKRDDVSGPIPIGDGHFTKHANSPEEMLGILQNPSNGMQEVLDAVGVTLENTIKIREIVRTEKAEATEQESKSENNPSGNRLVTDERYAELRERMRKKLLGQMNMGIDPEILAIGTEMAVYHLEKGARKFTEYATAMIADLGDSIRPYLKAFYNGARDLPEVAENGLDADMTPYDEVQQFDVANFDKKSIDALATAEAITREAEVEQEAEIAQERIKKSRPARKKNEKKTVNSQQSNELGLFDSLIDNNKNSENGLQRTDAARSERLPADGVQGSLPGSLGGNNEEVRQDGGGTDGGGTDGSERTGGEVQPGNGRPAGRLQGLSEPKNTHNNRGERGKDHAPTSVDARIEANIKAIELAKQLLESGEQATENQMQTLRKFSGWGGLGKAFSEGTSYAPNPIQRKLRELLGERAYQEAVMSANSAYYTPAYVVDTLWDIAEKMGFEGGNILEGSAGIGNILGQMPTHISERSDIHAIEIDGTSGGILSLLYPDATVEIQGFEQTRIPNGSVDLAITNVPFVTGLRVNDTTGDKDLSKKFHNIHDFCIAKNVRKLREGGLGIFITSNGTLDNSKKLRDWIVNEGGADFVGAFRMHNKTFGGTGVTSDIVVIRKRVNGQKSVHAIDVSDVSGERMAEYDTGETRKVKGKETPVIKQLSMDYNRYFIEHPENMAGEMHFAFEKGDTFRPTSKGLYPKQDKKQEEMLAEFVRSFRAEEFGERTTTAVAEVNGDKKVGEVFVRDGKLYINSTASAQPLEVNANKVKGHTKVECFEAYTAIKEALAEVLSYQTESESDEGLKPLLDKLNKAYDDFVGTYGHFNKNTAIAFLRHDVDYANVSSVETYKETGDGKGGIKQTFGKADVMNGRVVEKEKEPTPANVKDGIIASIFKFGRVDVPYIAEQLGKSEAGIRKEIIEGGFGFEDPVNRQIEVAFRYKSGNIREKLRQAEENNENGEFDRNIKALQDVMPMEIPAHLIDFTLGSSWIDPKLYEDFVKERTEVSVRLTTVGGTWFMKEPYFTNYEKNRAMGVTSEMLGRTIMGHTLIGAAITNKSITVSTTQKKWDGTTETITDKEATQACAAKIDEIRQDFKDWARQKMQGDPEMSERMERIYNDMFNNYVPMSIPDEFVPEYFGGASHKFKMRSHQGRAIVRGTMQPLMLAHEVGSGKTFTLISTAMEMRRLGTARKPMIVVQNATVGQFVASAKELYPNAKILTLEEDDRGAKGRKNFYAKIRYNDWDMIVVPQSTFEFIPDSEEREMTFVQDKIEEKMLILEKMKEEDPDGKNMITRQAEREIEQLEAQLAGLADNASKKRTANDEKKRAVALQNAEVKAMEMLDRRTDDVENFDDMGIDALLVDEAHEYKHLGFATAMQRGVKGVDPSYSKKSQGVFLKTQAVLEKNNGRNVIFATGTPISNTAAEIWTFMRYLMPADTMKEYGIYYFDDFVRNFGNIQQMLEFTTSGKFKENNRFAGYVNLPELVRIWSGVADTVQFKEIEEDRRKQGKPDLRPEIETGKAQDIYLPQTRALRSVMKYVKSELEAFDKMSGKEKKENSHIPLTMYGIAKAAAVDARLVQADAEDDPNSKTNEAVRQTLRSLKETDGYKGTVAIFADNYQNKQSGFNLYDDIRRKLIEEGVPANEVVVIRSSMSDKRKLETFEKVNRGEVRVVLGSTYTLGTGVNIQERLHTLIHLDAPNRPMDYTQRNGRILRQGNLHKDMNKPVRILRFGVEDSLDVTAYQRLKTKGAIADSIMNGKQMMNNSMTNRVLEEEEDVFGDTVAQLSGSEYAMLKNNAEKNVRKYASRKKQWETDQTYIHNAKPRLKAFIKDAEKRIEDNGRYLDAVRSSFPNGQFKEIVTGKHRFVSVDTMDDFFKEHNKSILAEMKQMKDGEISGEQKRELIIQIGDFSFVVTTKLTRKTMSNGATLFNDVERRMTYSCLELGIEDVPVRQNLLHNAIEDITDNVITGKDFAERLSAGERSKKHNEAELKELLSREGKPFEYEEELAQAKAQLEEYAELMKKELEEKEAKYAEMDASVETANNISASEEDDELKREGGGTYTDDEVSYENDPVAKLLGQSRRTAKQRREFAQRERQRMAERVESLAEKLHLDNVEVVTDASVLDGKKQRAKGFYSKSTGKITIVIPNHTSTFDVEQTLLHEAVAHYGLRQLFGEHFDTFLDNVFNNADENIRRRIVDMAAKNGWDFHKATEEYLASLAEDTEFENINASWWQQIKDFFLNMLHKIGFEDFRGVTLSDNELRYILWRSFENLAEPGRYRNILGEAADVAKQYELKVGNYAVSDPHHLTVAESDDALYRTGDPEIHERELARDRYERRVKSGMFQSREALQDSMLGLKEAMTAILGKETNIEDVDGFENAYLGENRLSSVNKAEADAFAHTLFKPMLDEVAKLARTEAEREELIDYMMAKHGLERNTYMRNEAINNGATDADQTDYAGLTALTGMDNITDAETEAQIMVNDYEQAHDTTDLWKKVNAASKAILSKSYECGMMSKATFDKISDMYDFYIPLRGFDEKTSSEAYAYLTHKQSAFNAPIKKAEGRRSKADDPFANLQSMAEGAIMQGNRNKLVKQRFLNFALNHSSDLVSVSDIWVEYDTVADEWKPVFPDNIDSTDTPEVVERKMLDFETKMESLAQQYPDRYKHGKDTVNIPYRIVESRDMRQHQIVVKRGGRDYVITINGNPRAAQALNGQTNPDNDMSGAIGAILRAGENINRQLSAFYTTRNPDFIVSNFMRDMLYTNTMTWIRESPNYALRFHRNYMYANPVRIKQLLAKHRKGTLDMSNKTEAMFHQFMMNGGETGYANIRDIEQHKNDIRRELKKSNGKIPVKKAWDLLGERFDEYNRAVENCARFAAFMTSREMGRSIDRAIYDAKEISVNFNKKGSGAKFYDSTGQTKAGNASALVSGLGRSGYVFWNAAIQGTANFGRQMKRHPAKAFTGIAAMFLLGAIVAYLGGDDDDDDDKNAYYNLPEYVRRSNILFRAGNSWVSIPLPVEYRAVYGMGELMISVLNGKEHLTDGEIAEAITGQATQILPIDFLEGGGGLNAFVPSAYKPLWEAYVAEKSWTGMPLYKDTPYNKDMPEWTKAYKSANKYIVGLANAMNEATGGDPYTKGTIDFNPAKIEYMLNGYFGGVFGTIDKLSKTAETITDNREYDPRSFLLVNRLVKAGDERTEYRAVNNEYFRLKEEHDRLKSRLKHYEEDTDNDIFDYAEKIDFLYNSPEYERYEIFEDYRRDIDDLYNELNDTVDDEERKNIEAELNELKKEMIEEMNKTRK